jgi:fatty-acyl-CoA synthase
MLTGVPLAETISSLVENVAQRAKGIAHVARFDPEQPMSLALLLKRWVETAPDRTFLVFEGRTWTYREMDRLVARRAAALARRGISRGDTVALMMSNRPAFVVHALALSRLGAVPSLINTLVVGAGLRHAVMVTSPAAVIVGSEHRGAFDEAFDEHRAELGIPVLLDDEAGRIEGALPDGVYDVSRLDDEVPPGEEPATLIARGTDLAAFIYTSGTTGLPKAGKVLNARSFAAGYGFGMFALGLGPRDVYYCCLPLFHSNGFLVWLSSGLVSGARLALARKFSVHRFWDDIHQTGSTVFVYIGEVCRYLLNGSPHPHERDHQLRAILGNGMRPDVWDAFVERFRPGRVCEFYGATEGNVNMINFLGKRGSVGRMPPLPKLDNALLVRFDQDSQAPARGPDGRCIRCEPDEVGELLGRINPALVTQRFDGYVGSEATESKILRDVLEPGDAYFRSGDLLKRDRRGFYYFVDRIGDTFRWKGENVSTNEVGDAVQRHEAVEIANTYGVAVEGADGRAGMVALLLKPGHTFDPDSFYAHVSSALPSFAQPAFVRIVNAASLTATFKLKKVDLVRDAYDPERVDDDLYFRDDQGRTYARIDQQSIGRIRAGQVRL